MAKQSHSDPTGGSNTRGNRPGHAFNRCCPIFTFFLDFTKTFLLLSLQVFNPCFASSTFTEPLPAAASKGVAVVFERRDGGRIIRRRDRLRIRTFSSVAQTAWAGAAKLPLTRTCGTYVASPMLRHRKMNVAGRFTDFCKHGTWCSSFYDGGVLWSNSSIMSLCTS
jgi:hypothetical protein